MSLAELINVQISIASAGIVAAGFGVPLIAGVHTRFNDSARYRDYAKVSDMIVDGFLTSDPEYILASALMSQKLKVERFVIGRRLTPVAQVWTVTIATVTNSYTYSLDLNGRTVTYVSDGSATALEIRDNLITNIAALSPAEPVTAVLATGTTFTITSTDAGVPLTVVPLDSHLTAAITTPNVGIEDDLTAIAAAGATWYSTHLTSRDPGTIYRSAVWVEANSSDVSYIGGYQTNEANTRDVAYVSSNPDLGARLKAAAFRRAYWMWHSTNAEGLVEAWAGRLLPLEPGTETWANKQLNGIPVDVHTTTQKNNVIGTSPGAGKNGNVYIGATSNNSITKRGSMASGDWIDLIRYVDSVKATISERIAQLEIDSDKIPYTDDGLQLIAKEVRGVLQDGEDAKKISPFPKFTVIVPRAADFTSNQRASRDMGAHPIKFGFQTSGAIHEADVTGEVTQ